MTALANRVVRQHGFLVSLLCGLVVLAVILVQSVLGALVSQLGFLGSEAPPWQWWVGYAYQFGSVSLPFAIGVTLSFWFIAPIGPDLHIAHVITRSLLAAGVGAVLVFLTDAVILVVSLIQTGLMGQIRLSGESVLQSLGAALSGAGNQFITVAPLVILVGVLLRLWLQNHPSEHHIEGIVDTA